MTPHTVLSIYRPYLYGALSAAAIGLAWLVPGTSGCAILGWVAALSLVLLFLSGSHLYRPAYCSALILNCVGFYWLCHTISVFGGFGTAPTLAVFALFVTLSAVQCLIVVFAYRRLPVGLDRFSARLACAFVLAEVVSVRLFPWHFGHTQLAFVPLAQCADLAGTLTLSFLLFWITEAFVRICVRQEMRPGTIFPFLVLASLLVYGWQRSAHFTDATGIPQRVALIQANVSIEEKHDTALIIPNIARYRALSGQVPKEGTFVIWPESVIVQWIADQVGSVANDPRLPYLSPATPMLIGSLSYNLVDPRQRYNSAFAIRPDGSVPMPYHKQILLPFGEFVPLGDVFPWLRELDAGIQDFTAGKEIVVFDYPMPGDPPYHLRAAPLICYEDAIPGPAREATKKGANLLVNLTNDAWFGNTAAPRQHQLIAAFRAIENRRFLVRATNTGITSVIDPIGQIRAQLPPFSDGTLVEEVRLLEGDSVYTRWVGEWPWRIVVGVLVVLVVVRLKTRRHLRQRAQEH